MTCKAWLDIGREVNIPQLGVPLKLEISGIPRGSLSQAAACGTQLKVLSYIRAAAPADFPYLRLQWFTGRNLPCKLHGDIHTYSPIRTRKGRRKSSTCREKKLYDQSSSIICLEELWWLFPGNQVDFLGLNVSQCNRLFLYVFKIVLDCSLRHNK